MKARLLIAKENAATGSIMPVGTIISEANCYWLCHLDNSFIRPLNAIKVDFVTEPGRKVAEPADEECLAKCQELGWLPMDYVLKPAEPAVIAPPAAVVPNVVAPVEPSVDSVDDSN